MAEVYWTYKFTRCSKTKTGNTISCFGKPCHLV